MESCETWFMALAIVSGFLFGPAATEAGSWDIAVLIRDQIEFLDRNGTSMGISTVANNPSVYHLAYDSVTHTLYMASLRYNVPVFTSDLIGGNLTVRPISNDTRNRRRRKMACDPETNTLFWMDPLSQTLMTMQVASVSHPSDGIDASPTTLHTLIGYAPYDIAVDICHRFVYWSTNNETVGKIKRSRLDGTDRRVILDEFRGIRSLAVDNYAGKLYYATYTDDRDGLYSIYRKNLDGTNRTVLINLRAAVDRLVVDEEAVYFIHWWSVWRVEKDGTGRSLVKNYDFDQSIGDSTTRNDIRTIGCEAVLDKERTSSKSESQRLRQFIDH